MAITTSWGDAATARQKTGSGLYDDPFAGGGQLPQEGRASSSTYMSQPDVTNPLAASLASLQQSLAGQYQGLLQNPTASPLYQGQLGPLLQSMVPSEDRARTSLTDTFRAAGGLRSGAYGRSASQLEGDILGNRQEAAGKLLGQAFPQLMQALQNPMSQISSLIDALKLSQSQGAYTGKQGGFSGGDPWANISPSLGLATPMQGDRMASTGNTNPFLSYGGSAQTGVNYQAPTQSGASAPTVNNAGSYDLLSRLLGGGSGVTYNPVTGSYESAPSSNLGSFTPTQGGAAYPAPTPEWNPTTGAYQGGYQPSTDYAATDWEY